MDRCFVLWEFSRKQDYIFRSNKLKENIGASLIMRSLSEDLVKFSSDKNNSIRLDENKFIIKGGGKCLYVFDEEIYNNPIEDARLFVKEFSKMILTNYPGLEVFIVLEEFKDSDNTDIKKIVNLVYDKLEKKKNNRRNSSCQIGFGIEQKCASTGNPANGYESEEKRFICSEINSKIEFGKNKDNEDNFRKLLPIDENTNKNYKLLKSINDMIKDDSKNYLAIVHIDGNGMGKKIKDIENNLIKGDDESTEDFNQRYIDTMKSFSEQITKANEKAFRYMTGVISKNKCKLSKYTNIEDGEFPLRPLILAGDDVTYITAGVIGVESAKIFIEKLNECKVRIKGIENEIDLHACAGIAIVKHSYPYIKAYNLAEELCQNAKRFISEFDDFEGSAMDFHISQGDMNKSISEVRECDYKSHMIGDNDEYLLTMKPVLVNDFESDNSNIFWRNYSNLIEAYRNINTAINEEAIGRSKIIQLKEAFKQGKESAKNFMRFYNIKPERYLRSLDGTDGDYGFNMNDKRCMYLDAIEMIDLFIELER